MLLVEEGIERGMEGLNLSLRRATEESMPLSEVDGVVKHVKLWESTGVGLCLPVLMDVIHCTAPGVDIGCCPVARVEERMMKLLKPSFEDRMRGLRSSSNSRR